MLKKAIPLTLLFAITANANPWFNGSPEFIDEASEQLARTVLNAHGGMDRMQSAKSLKYSFFTKAIGGSFPFYSIEHISLSDGSAYLEWPLFDASIAWDQETVWSDQWNLPLPAGFFARLTSSFITLPWQIFADYANVGPVSKGTLPQDTTEYDVLRVTFDERNPSIPGTFYEMFIDPENQLMKAIRFDINHPGMAANPAQPLGPNLHVFGEFQSINGLIIPSYYQTYGQGGAQGQSSAYHFVWGIQFDQPFDEARLIAPATAVDDPVSVRWWQSEISE